MPREAWRNRLIALKEAITILKAWVCIQRIMDMLFVMNFFSAPMKTTIELQNTAGTLDKYLLSLEPMEVRVVEL